MYVTDGKSGFRSMKRERKREGGREGGRENTDGKSGFLQIVQSSYLCLLHVLLLRAKISSERGREGERKMEEGRREQRGREKREIEGGKEREGRRKGQRGERRTQGRRKRGARYGGGHCEKPPHFSS